jgi:predicted nucleic acid-binding protein
MTVEAFLDTNVVIYAASKSTGDAEKRAVALDLIAQAKFGLSGQVLQEFYVTATKKMTPTLSHDEALNWVEQLEEFPCVSVDGSIVFQGAENSHFHKISYWDGAIIAAAERLGAQILYTEDLNHGQKYGSVTAINPFRTQ